MDAALIVSFITALGSFLGVVWVIYNGRKTLKATATVSMFDQAMELVDAKDAEIKRLNEKVAQQEKRIVILERRVAIQKERVRRLIESLAIIKRVPVDVVRMNDLIMNDDDEDDEDSGEHETPRRKR